MSEASREGCEGAAALSPRLAQTPCAHAQSHDSPPPTVHDLRHPSDEVQARFDATEEIVPTACAAGFIPLERLPQIASARGARESVLARGQTWPTIRLLTFSHESPREGSAT